MLGVKDNDINLSKEILSGIVIAIALIPEAIAFSFMLGVSPVVGLYTSVIICFITAIFGGRPAMISAATGAVAAVFAPLVKDYGVEYLFLAVILMGVFQILFAILDIGKLFRLMSKPLLLGCVNGLALIVFSAQLEQFKVPGTDNWLSGTMLFLMLTLTMFTCFLIFIIPKFIKTIPSSLIAIIITTTIALLLDISGIHMYTVYDMATSRSESIVRSFAPINVVTLKIILIPALSAALVGIIESLLTLNIIDEITNTRGNSKKEVIAQGVGNIVSGFAFGMGGCAMIGQSMINLNNGARKYLSTFIASITLLIFIIFGKNIIGIIPLAALVGVMFVVVFKTFAWDSILLHKKADLFDTFIVIFIALVIGFSGNLALGVLLGVLLSVLRFTWVKTTKLEFSTTSKHNICIINITGVLFFGTEYLLKKEIDNIIKGSTFNTFTLDLSNTNISDYSGAQALFDLIEKNSENNIQISIINLNEHSKVKYERINKIP